MNVKQKRNKSQKNKKTISEQVIEIIRKHNIKSNKVIAFMIGTTPQTVAVIKNRLVKKGILSEKEAYKNKRKKKVDWKELFKLD